MAKVKKKSPRNLAMRKQKLLDKSVERSRLKTLPDVEFISIVDLENPNQNVMVPHLPNAFKRSAKLIGIREVAAIRFSRDHEALNAGLKSVDFEPRVDSSPVIQNGNRATEAKARLDLCRASIGVRNYEICEVVILQNLNATKIHAMGGRDHRSVNHDIDVALNALVGFYDEGNQRQDPTWRAVRRMLQRGEEVIAQGERDLNWPSNPRIKKPRARRSSR